MSPTWALPFIVCGSTESQYRFATDTSRIMKNLNYLCIYELKEETNMPALLIGLGIALILMGIKSWGK